MPVAEVLRITSAREFTEWMAYDRLDPIGDDRADWNAASIACAVTNPHRTKKEPYKVKDFMPQYGTPERPSPEALHHKIKSVFGALATRKRKPDDGDDS